MFCCLTASTTRALLCMADAKFRIQVMVQMVVACHEPEHCHLFPSVNDVRGQTLTSFSASESCSGLSCPFESLSLCLCFVKIVNMYK